MIRDDDLAALALGHIKGLPVDLARLFAELFVLLIFEGCLLYTSPSPRD